MESFALNETSEVRWREKEWDRKKPLNLYICIL